MGLQGVTGSFRVLARVAGCHGELYGDLVQPVNEVRNGEGLHLLSAGLELMQRCGELLVVGEAPLSQDDGFVNDFVAILNGPFQV